MPPIRVSKSIRRVLQGVLAAVIASGLIACGGQTPVEEATADGILLMGNSSEPKGLDPHIVSGVLENNIIRSLFEGLVIEDPEKNGEYLPGVAERVEHNEDSSEWTFHLRKDAKWSDGHPLTSEDFVFAFRRILTPSLGSDYSFMLYYIKDAEAFHRSQRSYLTCREDESFPVEWETLKKVDFAGNEEAKEDSYNLKGLDHLGIEKLKEIAAGSAKFTWPEDVSEDVRKILVQKNIEFIESGKEIWDLVELGATAPDPHTLVVKLRGPLPFLPEVTKHYTWFPVPKHVVLEHGKMAEPFTEWTKPGNLVGNGAFKLKSWRINDHIEVERNPEYWDAGQVGLNGIRFLPVSNGYTETRMFISEQMHLTYKVPPEMMGLTKERYPTQLRVEPWIGTYFIRCNVDDPAFKDKRVRHAFSLAIDQRSIIDNVVLGNQPPATGLVPAFSGYPASDVVKFDPERARELLVEAGYPGGKGLPEIVFLTTDQESAKPAAEALQAMWKEHLGVKIRIQQMEWTSYLANMFDQKYGLAAGGWIGDYLDPLTFLDMWMKDGGNNRTGWSSEEFESLLNQAQQTGDQAQRYTLLKKAEEIFLEDRPVLPIYWYTRNYLISPDVKGWNPLILDNHPYKFVTLEGSE